LGGGRAFVCVGIHRFPSISFALHTVQEKRTKSKPFTGMFAQQNGSIPDCNSQLSSITHG